MSDGDIAIWAWMRREVREFVICESRPTDFRLSVWAAMQDIVGKLNKQAFRGFAPLTWMCSGSEMNRDGANVVLTATYQRKHTWDVVCYVERHGKTQTRLYPVYDGANFDLAGEWNDIAMPENMRIYRLPGRTA